MAEDSRNSVAPETKQPYKKGTDRVREEVFSSVLEEHDLFRSQREKRVDLLKRMEKHTTAKGKRVGYLGFFCASNSAIDSDDIPAFGDCLMSLGDLDQLNLVINSPGGDGTTAEKMIDLCRCYCKEFRVVIPNRAKSAATIIALGSDQIVMGHCSELGPIDAQVPIVIGGLPRYISAQSFLDARSELRKQFKEAVAKKEDPRPILQEVAALDPPFLDHCEKLMGFSREVARKCLAAFMLKAVKPKAKQRRMIDHILTELSSVGVFKVHGRMVNANTAKTDLRLNVDLLGKDDPLWRDLWQYYVRADVLMSRGQTTKLIETKNEILLRGVYQ